MIKRLLFVPLSMFLWLVYAYNTLIRPCGPDYHPKAVTDVTSCSPMVSDIALILLAVVVVLNIYNVIVLIRSIRTKRR